MRVGPNSLGGGVPFIRHAVIPGGLCLGLQGFLALGWAVNCVEETPVSCLPHPPELQEDLGRNEAVNESEPWDAFPKWNGVGAVKCFRIDTRNRVCGKASEFRGLVPAAALPLL